MTDQAVPPQMRKTTATEHGLIFAVCALVAVAAWFALPPTVIIFNDDFGYVRSIIETLQHGRPWTDDWLEPWAASQSVLSALLFKLTGSMRVATYGLQAVLAGTILRGLIRLLQARGCPIVTAIGWGLVGILLPSLTWKLAEFGAMPLYLACLLVVLRAFDERRWLVFGVAWLVAMSSRQSALLWCFLPAGMWLERAWNDGSIRWRAVGAAGMIGVSGVLAYLALGAIMNRTHAQATAAPYQLGSMLHLPFWKAVAVALGVFAAAAGLGGFVFGARRGSWREIVQRPRRWGLAVAGVVVVTILRWADLRQLIEFEHPFWRDGAGSVVFHLLSALALLGWWCGEFRVRLAYLATAVGFAVVLGLRGLVWEYYLADVALLGFFSVQRTETSEAGGPVAWIWTALHWVVIAVVIWLQVGIAASLKRQLDFNHGVVVLCERGLRAGLIAPAELSAAPFGFQGWHLYPYYRENEGAGGGYIADFVKYLRPGSLRVMVEDPAAPPPSISNGRLQAGETLLQSDVLGWNWTETRRYSLVRYSSATGAEWKIIPARYRFDDFCLNDAEWRERLQPKYSR